MITGREIRDARALLKWTVPSLRMRANVAEDVIRRAESVDGTPSITLDQARRLQDTFERAGVEFSNPIQPVVQLRSDRI